MKNDPAIPVRPRWDAVFLVCKACGKRSKAPKGLKSKALMGYVRAATRGDHTRPGIIQTGCLGLCPKGAVAVAYVSGDAGPRIVAVRTRSELEAALPLLRKAPIADVPSQ